MMNEKMIEKIEEVVMNVTGCGNVTNEEISFCSGRMDLETYIPIDDLNTIEEVKDRVFDYYQAYDVDEEVKLWLQCKDAPYVETMIYNLKAVEENLEDLAIALAAA